MAIEELECQVSILPSSVLWYTRCAAMQELHPQIFRFHQVDDAPQKSGVYAWYCRYELPQRDTDELIQALKATGTPEEKREMVKAFLRRRVFSYFAEAPYSVSIYGPLKPRYEGEIPHVLSISDSLADRIVKNPERIMVLAQVLRTSIPHFASPLYIGSAKSLRDRLKTHVRLMRRLREGEFAANNLTSIQLTEEERADHTFAYEAIIQRRFDFNDLWVSVMPMDIPHEYTVDIENVLNRINFPLCGRN